jgi:hypothetical protein
MYRCEICEALYDEIPKLKRSERQPDGFWETLYEKKCFYCEGHYFSPYEPFEEGDEPDE